MNALQMVRCKLRSRFILAFAFLSLLPAGATGQANDGQPRIQQALDESKLTVLRGNTHPLARPEFDRGPAPSSLVMDRMLLVLKRSPEREAALEKLLAEQQDRSSPNYHRWLTSEEFGQQFGPSDQDIETITSWLWTHGFQVAEVSKGRTVVEFSGTAGQVQAAFHTAIHRYVRNGEEHWANASDPQIPTALAPVVAGVNTLHNFPKKPMSHRIGRFSKSKANGDVTALSPDFTYGSAQNNCGSTSTPCFALGPYDFATIYNVLPLWAAGIDGRGETIAVVGQSNIDIQDVANFRASFGLPPKNPTVQLGGTDPGLQLASGDEGESDLDVEWSGGVARGANIVLVASASTSTSAGVDLSALYIVNAMTPIPQILAESYGNCEAELGTAGNTFFSSLWQQAAAEGITVVISTGDNGSAGCDSPNPNATTEQPATMGLAVSGLASTPYNVAVGGTDFDQFTDPTAFWNSSNDPSTLASAKGYIPETTYNDSCTNAIFGSSGGSTNAETNCNNKQFSQSIAPVGGGGGVSACTTSNQTISSCSGGYSKPSWQTGPGVPNDGKRDLPDLSLFAGDGLAGSFYIVCEADTDLKNAPCSLSSPYTDFSGFGGTSASVQTFAGIMALVDQRAGDRQGNANPALYTLAAEESSSACNASSPASTCVFNDVTVGTIAAPCVKNSPNCTVATASDANGILFANGTPAYSAGTGFDLATGLGSVNANNLVNKWGPNFYLSSASPAVTVASPGASGTMTLAVTAVNGFTGAINFTCSGLPTGATCNAPSIMLTKAATTASATLTVNTTAASSPVGPVARHQPRGRSPAPGEVTLLAIFSIGILLASFGSRHRRSRTALALVVLEVVLSIASCGGSGSSGAGAGAGGKTGTTTSTITGTASTGSPAYTMSFTVTIR
jgi:subtilase family serine protease